MTPRGRRRAAWIALLVSMLGGALSVAGYAMVASFLAAGAAPEPRLRTMAWVYLIVGGACLVIAVAAIGVLARTRAVEPPGPAI